MKTDVVDLTSLALNFAEELKQSQPGRTVDFIIKPGMAAHGDHNLLLKVIQNLFRNAWKFTGKHDHARIEFGCEKVEGELVYCVRDDGAGFDMRYADRLFMPFQRLHTTEEFPGNGIGLATVQRIIKRHGGRIWIKSAVEQGAAVYFTLKAEDHRPGS